MAEPGNISAVTEWSLTDLQIGLYGWRLRAVDAAYVGSDIAVGVFSIGVSSIDNSENTLPVEYSLEQNYPNPFNPSTTISYSIPASQNVALKIFDMNGKEVRTLVDKHQSAGSYTVEFNGADLSSGMYFYRLQTSSFTITKKMSLVK